MTWIIHYLAQVSIDPESLNIPQGNKITSATVEDIMEVVFGIAGAVALLIIVLAGLRYTTSQGDPSSTAKAKSAIIYALIGLMIALLGFAIVRFVVRNVG